MSSVALDKAMLLVFPSLSPDEVLDALAHDRVQQSQVTIALSCTPEQAGCALSDFNLAGNSLDVQQYLKADSGSWMVTLQQSDQGAVASLFFVDPVAGTAPVDQVSVPAEGALLSLSVDLQAAAPVQVAEGQPVVFDWSRLSTDALGNAVSSSRTDRLTVASFSESLTQLETDFVQLEDMAEQQWDADVTGATSLDTAQLDGFAGFTSDQTWLLLLRCSTCLSPAPRFIAVIQ